MDSLANLAYGTVLTAPSPATTGTSLVLNSGQGALFPTAPFDILVWPAGSNPFTTNAELARCTVKATDTLTITRNQYGTTARSIVVGDQVCQPIDANLLNQLLTTVQLSTITADPNPAVVGTYYRANYAANGNFTLPSSSVATGAWVEVKQIAANTLSIVGTVDGNASFTLSQYQAYRFIYNGTNWDVT